MCGRARCTVRPDDIPRACHRSGGPTSTIDIDRYRPGYNMSPGWNVPVVRRDDEAGNGGGEDGCPYAVHVMKWGLIPSFTKKTEKPDFYRMFNARAESVGEKASFRRLLPKNRCLVTVEGFYEWKKEGSKKQPYYIHFKDGRPLVFAALYDSWKNSEGEMLYTFTIVTTSSSPALQWLHDRMPVILGDKGAIDMWLNNSSPPKLDVVLKPYEESDLGWYPVTTAMGKPSYDGPECVKEIQLKADDKGTISKFFSRKQIKEERESEQVESSTADDPRTTGNSTEEKYGCRESVDVSETKVVGYESIPDTSLSKDDTKFRSKREHEELPADGEPGKDSVGKLDPTPPRKKPNLKTATDKQQPTLLSFFGKK